MTTPVAFSSFGSRDIGVYRLYLETFSSYVSVCRFGSAIEGGSYETSSLSSRVGDDGGVGRRAVGFPSSSDALVVGVGGGPAGARGRFGAGVEGGDSGAFGVAGSDGGPVGVGDTIGVCRICASACVDAQGANVAGGVVAGEPEPEADGCSGIVEGADVVRGAGRGAATAGVGSGSVDSGASAVRGGRGVVGQAAGGVTQGQRVDESGRGVASWGQLPRGKNFERNQRNREAKRRTKARAVAGRAAGDVAGEPLEWRCGQGVARPQAVRGYFADCAPEVRQQLRESRARMLVAENEVKAKLAAEKLRKLSSPEQTLKDLQRVMSLGSKVGRMAGPTPIAGWAETVVDSVVKSVGASSTSENKFPELSEVGVGRSLSVDSSTAAAAALKPPTPRELEYQAAKALVERKFEELDAYQPHEYAEALGDVRREYGDVIYSASEWKLRKELLDVAGALMDFRSLDDLRNAIAEIAYKDDEVEVRTDREDYIAAGCW